MITIFNGKLHELDNVLNGVADGSFFSERAKVVRQYPNLKNVAYNYKKAIDKADSTVVLHGNEGQVFSNLITYGEKQDVDYYNILWDIQRAKQIIVKEEIPIRMIKTEDAITYADVTQVETEHLDQVDVSLPLIMVAYPVLNTFILIDGNHRVTKQYLTDKTAQMPVYILDESQQQRVMAGDLFRVLYKIHHNITEIGNYMCGFREIKDLKLFKL